MNPGIYITIDEVIVQYQIDWTFSKTSDGGYLQILVNGVEVVYATGNSGNNFMINPGDYITVNTRAIATSSLIAVIDLYVYDSVDGVLYSDTAEGIPLAELSYGPYYPSGNGEIASSASEY